MKRIISFGILLTIIVSLCYFLFFNTATLATPIDAEDFLRVGTCADFPPFQKINQKTGKIIGFDIDLIQEIAKRLGKKVIIKDMPFNSLVFHVTAGHIDVIAAALSATEDRETVLSFSDTYLRNDYIVLVTKTNTYPIQSLNDLHGKTIAVNTNYSADIYLATIPGIRLNRFNSLADSVHALQKNKIDAFATCQNSFNAFIQQQLHPEQYQHFIIPNTAEHCVFAFAKNNHKLREQINTVLKAMEADGTLAEIKKTWGFHETTC